MSTALAVCHGSFGRVTVYRLDKPMRTHAHREGHLTFDLGAPPAIVTISNVPHLVDETAGLAINLPVVNCLTSDVGVPAAACACRRGHSASSQSTSAFARRGK
jgi:hypothetical protein